MSGESLDHLALGLTAAGFVAVRRDLRPGAAVARYEAIHRGGDARAGVGVPFNIQTSESDEGPVHKFLLPVPGIPDRATGAPGPDLSTESVVIPMRGRARSRWTLCVSSQVGCAMGCAFCETARMGLMRSLTPAEIVAQWWAARWHLGHEISNIVFMGMGEPLDNLDAVLDAIRVLTDHRGPALAMSHIAVSTVGRLDGLARLREQVQQPGWKRLGLAVSINAPSDEIRSQIMPINRAMPLRELVRVMEDWPLRSASAICAEYVLIPGVNDEPEHARQLAALLQNVRCCVNVIPYNPRPGSPWPAPDEATVDRFMEALRANGQYCKRRRTKGRDTMSACGQLGSEHIRGRRFVTLGTGPSEG